jgi:hypothetical protein
MSFRQLIKPRAANREVAPGQWLGGRLNLFSAQRD